MKLLLVNPPMMGVPSFTRAPTTTHLQLLYSFLRGAGVDVGVLDPCVDLGLPGADRAAYLQELTHHLARRPFDVAGISCWTGFHQTGAFAVGRILRELHPHAPVLVGGSHVTTHPQEFLGDGSPFDWVVQGPGERVLLDICQQPRRPSQPTLLEGKAVPLDQVVLDWSYPYKHSTLFLSRGCPFGCMFCVERGDALDCYSLDRAVEEYAAAARASTDGFVHIQDACFGLDRAWRRQFLERIARLDLPARPDLEMRVDQVDEEDLEQLSRVRARFYTGVESGSPEMIRIMRKSHRPEQHVQRVRELADQLDRRRIEHSFSILYNHPGETRQTMQESTQFFWKLIWDRPPGHLKHLAIHRYSYVPGSPLDKKLDHFRDAYGTLIHHPTWWREEVANQRELAEHNTASRDLSPEEATQMAQKFHVANWYQRLRQEAAQAPAAPTG